MADGRRNDHPDRVRQAASDGGAAARSALEASWRRSIALHGLDPEDRVRPVTLSERELLDAQGAMEPLMRAAQPAMDRLFMAVGDTGCCVLLTDAKGILIDRRGSVSDDSVFQRWGLWQGAVWSEAVEGTNGIGTALAEDRMVTIHKDQHFHTKNIGLSCTTAPIHDHLGRLAGALDVSSARADLTEGFAGLIASAVADAARTIEAQTFRQAFPDARIVLAGDGDKASALLAVDRHDLIVGATRAARQMLRITDERIAAALPAADILGFSGASSEAELLEAERGAVRRALARAGGNVSAAARALGVSRATMHRKLNRLGLSGDH